MIRTLKSIGAVVMVFVMLTLALSNTAYADAIISSEAEEHILNELRRAHIPNAAIAAIHDGEISYVFRDSTQDTLFQIGSVTKSFTGFGVLLLEDMELLSVRDPVNKHLSWFQVNYNGISVPHEDLTIYNLLQHTSGFTSDERLFRQAAVTETTDEFIEQIAGLELAFYPSERFVYGNINYIILGLLIEAVSGQSYDEFMTQHVLHPLGLYSTFTDMQRAHETGRVIGGHRLRFLQPVSWNPPANPTNIPTGFIYTNIVDMARWAGIHLGTVDVSEQFTRVVQRAHENNHGLADPFADMNFTYAAGLMVRLETGIIGHYGSAPSYFATLRMYPQSNMAVVVLGNLQQNSEDIPFGTLVSDAIDGEPFSNVGTGLWAIFDIIYTITVVGAIVYIGFFIRFIVRVIKQLNSGETKNRKLTFKIRWLIVPLLLIVDLVYSYSSITTTSNTSHEWAVMNLPASLTPALIALLVMVLCSLCVFTIRVIGLSPMKFPRVAARNSKRKGNFNSTHSIPL